MSKILAVMTDGKPQIQVNKELLTESWPASWIALPGAAQKDYGVYFFRKTFYMKAKPKYFPVHVTADNRYRLFINGVPVSIGPARSDLFKWYYESIDLSPYLIAGHNTIAAQVWNMGHFAPAAHISNRTAFLVQGDTLNEDIVNTDQSWRVIQSRAYKACVTEETAIEKNNATEINNKSLCPFDEVNGAVYPWGWQQQGFNDSKWDKAEIIASACPLVNDMTNRWILSPRAIPLMDEHLLRFVEISHVKGLQEDLPQGFLRGTAPVRISYNRQVTILIDQTYNTVAYPELMVSGGKYGTIKMTYANSLNNQEGLKNDLDFESKTGEMEGGLIDGNFDIFLPDGGENRLFRPLWFRSYRYIQLDITTAGDELVIHDFHAMKTGYPMKLKASFASNDPQLQEIWNMGWRTIQNCSGESFQETPYYEQLKYTWDSRIQALIALYTSGDDRSMRKSIVDFYNSRTRHGLFKGSFHGERLDSIPTYSLFWVCMIHDYWMHRKDDDFVKQFLPAINEIMAWYQQRMDKDDHMLGPLNWRHLIGWDNSPTPSPTDPSKKGNCSIISMQLAYTLRRASDLFKAFKNEQQSKEYLERAVRLSNSTYQHCFHPETGLMADTPEMAGFSEQAAIWGILSDAVKDQEAKVLMNKTLSRQVSTDQNKVGTDQTTFFHSFYFTQALKKAGMADHYWSASPNYDFLATICGVMPDSPGFATVRIQPALGGLQEVTGRIPHPFGTIAVNFKRKGKSGLNATITLPENLSGILIWEEKSVPLDAGEQNFDL